MVATILRNYNRSNNNNQKLYPLSRKNSFKGRKNMYTIYVIFVYPEKGKFKVYTIFELYTISHNYRKG